MTETTDENAQNAEDTESTERFVSYTVTQDELTDEVLAKVVASCGDRDLTNRDLAFYYWQQYYTFVNNYGSYLSYIMDTSKGLDEQAYSEGQTWQQAFLDSAVTMFHSMTAISATIFLVSVHWTLITTRILECMTELQFAQACAFSVVLILLVFLASGAMSLLARVLCRNGDTIGAR